MENLDRWHWVLAATLSLFSGLILFGLKTGGLKLIGADAQFFEVPFALLLIVLLLGFPGMVLIWSAEKVSKWFRK